MSIDALILPWQQIQWRALLQRRRDGTLPHALLFTGPQGVGKGQFARSLAQSLLCTQPDADGQACGHCRGCQLYAAGNHPDFQAVVPEEAGKDITVAQVRTLVAYQALTPQIGRRKVVLIEPAERMNANAANALLKTLEEPTADTLLLLSTHRPALLLATIRSRCQQLAFPPQHAGAALDWLTQRLGGDNAQAARLLRLANGAPFRAVDLAEGGGLQRQDGWFDDLVAVVDGSRDAVAVAAEWMESDITELLAWWFERSVELIRAKLAPATVGGEPSGRFQALAERVDLTELFKHQERVQQAMRLGRGQLNAQLLLEDLLLGWSPAGNSSARRTAARTR